MLENQRRAAKALAKLSNGIQHLEQSFDRQDYGFLIYCVPTTRIAGSASRVEHWGSQGKGINPEIE